MTGDPLAGPLRPDLLAIAQRIRPRERVLDLGCGDGNLLRYLADTRDVSGRGVEISEAGVLACVSKGLSVRQSDLHDGLDDYPSGSFDTVILSQTLPYLNDPLNVINDMLRIGQRAIVSFANWGHWRCRLSLLVTGRSPLAPGLPQLWFEAPRARPLTISDFRVFCEDNGIAIISELDLVGPRTLRWRLASNLRAEIVIFELGRKHAS